jgi:hypothetical protein
MIRHSSLPKLAQCACYESASGESSPAAARGTKMDEAFRFALAGDSSKIELLDTSDDKKAVIWAINQVQAIAGDNDIISDESKLKVKTPNIEHEGTEDCRIPSLSVSCDLKSGQVRGYYEQMAAYAYGNMERDFAPEWTCYLIFCDQQKIIKHHFSYDQSKAIVEEVLESANDQGKKPSPCEYCKWCANSQTCQALAVAANDTLEIVDNDIQANLAQLKEFLAADPERLSVFLKKASIFNSELVDWAKDLIRERLTNNEPVVGYKLQNSKGIEYCDAETIYSATQECSVEDIIELFGGKIKANELREFAEKRGIPFNFPAYRSKDIIRMVEDKPKKEKKIK